MHRCERLFLRRLCRKSEGVVYIELLIVLPLLFLIGAAAYSFVQALTLQHALQFIGKSAITTAIRYDVVPGTYGPSGFVVSEAQALDCRNGVATANCGHIVAHWTARQLFSSSTWYGGLVKASYRVTTTSVDNRTLKIQLSAVISNSFLLSFINLRIYYEFTSQTL
jgi:Flp pilus assembly protein TadG